VPGEGYHQRRMPRAGRDAHRAQALPGQLIHEGLAPLKADCWVGSPVDASAEGRVASGVDASQATNNTVKISNNIRTDSFITIPQYENHLFIRLSSL
jgi:hypothetical protein